MPVASAAAPAEAQLDELIPKIGMLILGARMPDMDHEAEHTPSRNRRVPDAATDGREWRTEVDRTYVRRRLDFWKNAVPVYIDIGDGPHDDVPRLRERWCLAYEPAYAWGPSVRTTSPSPPSTAVVGDGAHLSDHTNVVILLQSLYARVRQLPVGSDLERKALQREALCYRIWTTEDAASDHSASQLQHDLWANAVARHTFCAAELADGRLQLHVDYRTAAVDRPMLAPASKLAVDTLATALPDPMARAGGGASPKSPPTKRVGSRRSLPSVMEPGSPRPQALAGVPSAALGWFRLDGSGAPPDAIDREPAPATDASEAMTASATVAIPTPSARRGRTPEQAIHDDTPHRPSPRPSPSWSPQLGGARSWGGTEKPAASLVGSYEESLLNGRMSAVPARTIEFEAELGVFGQGHCRPSLKCPQHLHLPCPATFYQLPQEQPSPYVGSVHLPPSADDGPGLYRIPPRGVVQLIVRNPNKTVVKLFVVPYNLQDMPPQTRTFLRQTSYAEEQPTAMRFAIHLPLLCLRKGHHYVTGPIRVVFCHWMADGSSKLRVVATEPRPKYTPFSAADADDAGASDAMDTAAAPSPPPEAMPLPPQARSSPTKDPSRTTSPSAGAPSAGWGLPKHPVSLGFPALASAEPAAAPLSPTRILFPTPTPAPGSFIFPRRPGPGTGPASDTDDGAIPDALPAW